MRNITKQIEKKLAEITAADEQMAAKLQGGASFCDSFERALNEYCDVMINQVNTFREHLQAELQQLRPIMAKAAAELRGDEEKPPADPTNVEDFNERRGKKQ